MTDLGLDTTKDAALRLCAQVVEERDALRALVRDIAERCPRQFTEASRVAYDVPLSSDILVRVRLLARLDGRTA